MKNLITVIVFGFWACNTPNINNSAELTANDTTIANLQQVSKKTTKERLADVSSKQKQDSIAIDTLSDQLIDLLKKQQSIVAVMPKSEYADVWNEVRKKIQGTEFLSQEEKVHFAFTGFKGEKLQAVLEYNDTILVVQKYYEDWPEELKKSSKDKNLGCGIQE